MNRVVLLPLILREQSPLFISLEIRATPHPTPCLWISQSVELWKYFSIGILFLRYKVSLRRGGRDWYFFFCGQVTFRSSIWVLSTVASGRCKGRTREIQHRSTERKLSPSLGLGNSRGPFTIYLVLTLMGCTRCKSKLLRGNDPRNVTMDFKWGSFQPRSSGDKKSQAGVEFCQLGNQSGGSEAIWFMEKYSILNTNPWL